MARLEQKPYPQPEQIWQHLKTRHVVKIVGLHMVSANYKDGDTIFINGWKKAKSDIEPDDQCVIFFGDGQYYVREINNFLERFERCD